MYSDGKPNSPLGAGAVTPLEVLATVSLLIGLILLPPGLGTTEVKLDVAAGECESSPFAREGLIKLEPIPMMRRGADSRAVVFREGTAGPKLSLAKFLAGVSDTGIPVFPAVKCPLCAWG